MGPVWSRADLVAMGSSLASDRDDSDSLVPDGRGLDSGSGLALSSGFVVTYSKLHAQK